MLSPPQPLSNHSSTWPEQTSIACRSPSDLQSIVELIYSLYNLSCRYCVPQSNLMVISPQDSLQIAQSLALNHKLTVELIDKQPLIDPSVKQNQHHMAGSCRAWFSLQASSSSWRTRYQFKHSKAGPPRIAKWL